MEAALQDASALPSLRVRQFQFQIGLTITGAPDLALPAYDASLETPHVNAI
jgi:hypothetical protein